MLLEPPRTLPVRSLSVSSVSLFLRCPERWRRRYVEGEYEPPSGSAIVGSAVGHAEGHNFQQKIGSHLDLSAGEVLDAYSDEFQLAREQGGDTIDWHDERPGKVKDSGAAVLRLYHERVAPRIQPRSVERSFTVELPDVDWTFTGYLDLEVQGGVDDFKVRGASKGPVGAEEAAADIQPTAYLFARRAEGNPASRFRFHSLVRSPNPAPRHVLVTPTTRTEAQLDEFLDLLYRVAAEIAWRVEYDVWTPPPPGSWWCSQAYCGFWADCPLAGAALRGITLTAPKPIRRPDGEDVLRAIVATTRADGTTTAKRVGDHLGVSARSAAGSMRALRDHGLVGSGPPMKRYKTKPDVRLPGADHWWLVDIREQAAAA